MSRWFYIPMYTGVSINRGTLKLVVYHGKTYQQIMIWGYPHLWKPNQLTSPSFSQLGACGCYIPTDWAHQFSPTASVWCSIKTNRTNPWTSWPWLVMSGFKRNVGIHAENICVDLSSMWKRRNSGRHWFMNNQRGMWRRYGMVLVSIKLNRSEQKWRWSGGICRSVLLAIGTYWNIMEFGI